MPKTARSLVASRPAREEGCRAERADERAAHDHRVEEEGRARLGNKPLPAATTTASLVAAGSRFFLVYDNYEAILAYNCAHTYALSVALLSDRLR